MKLSLSLLIASVSASFGQMARPTITSQAGSVVPPSSQIPFTGVTVTSPSFTTNSLTFILEAIVSPITAYTFHWSTSGTSPGSVAFGSVNSTNTSVMVGGSGNYDFIGRASSGVRYAEVTVSVAVSVAANAAPTISSIPNVTTNEDFATYSIPFTIGDDQTAPGSLMVLAVSSNPNVLPNSSITLAGSGANRTISLTPLPNSNGVAQVTVSVTDGSASPATTQTSFTATWVAVNDPPVFVGVPASLGGTEDVSPINFSHTVTDVETAPGLLVETATADNASMVTNIVVTGGGTTFRNISVNLIPNSSGVVNIDLALTDGMATVHRIVPITVVSVNDTPTMSSTPDAQLTNGVAGQINFAIADVEDGGNLTLTRATDNSAVLPIANIIFGGSGFNRSATLTPTGVGTANITITATDSGGLQVARTFQVVVSGVPNTPPTLTLFANQITSEDNNLLSLPITVGDAETAAGSLILSVTISNPTLIASVALAGSGANRTASVILNANASGSATLVFSLFDGSATTTGSRTITVTPVNDTPAWGSQITQKSVQIGSPITVSNTVSDVETAASSLIVSASVTSGSGVSVSTPVNSNGNVTFTLTGTAVGTNTVQAVVSDGSATANNTFQVLVTQAPNTNPTITGLVNRTIAQGAVDNQTVTVGDAESGAAAVTITVSTSNGTLVPVANVIITGSGASRTVQVTPVASQSGSAIITLTAHDPNGGTANNSYTLVVTATGGRTFYAAPNGVGSSSNNGLTPSTPWDINSILSKSTKSLTAGDTVYLLDGTYAGRYVFSGAYGSSGHITFRSLNRNFQGKGAIFDRQNASSGDGAFDFGQGSSGIWFWDLNGTDTTPRLPPGTHDRGNPVYAVWRGDNNKIINCHVEQGANGIGVEDDASIPSGNFEIYGVWSEYNGDWLGDCQHGHAYYLQPKHPTDRFLVQDCVGANSMGQGMQVRTGDQTITLHNLEVNGCVFFNNGMPCSGSPSRNLFSNAGGDVDFNFKFRSNITFYPGAGGPGGLYTVRAETDSGHIGSPPNIHQNFLVDYNFIWHGDTMFGRQTPLNVYSNEFISTSGRIGAIFLTEFGDPPGTRNFNTLRGPRKYGFNNGGDNPTFQDATTLQWQARGMGANDILVDGDLTATRIWIRPNKYDPKLIMVVVANPSNAPTVTVTIPQIANDQGYQVYSVTDWDVRFSSGKYSGSIVIPMTGFPMRSMVQLSSGGTQLVPVSPGPTFGCFELILD